MVGQVEHMEFSNVGIWKSLLSISIFMDRYNHFVKVSKKVGGKLRVEVIKSRYCIFCHIERIPKYFDTKERAIAYFDVLITKGY